MIVALDLLPPVVAERIDVARRGVLRAREAHKRLHPPELVLPPATALYPASVSDLRYVGHGLTPDTPHRDRLVFLAERDVNQHPVADGGRIRSTRLLGGDHELWIPSWSTRSRRDGC